MARSLVIVESPAKAKTINKYLGRGFTVKASYGHVMDLPKKTIGILLPGDQNGKKKKRKSKAKGKGGKEVAEKKLPKPIVVTSENIFEPTYEVIPGKAKVIGELRKAAQGADAVYLAGDPDREGEAICAHLAHVLSKPYRAPVEEESNGHGFGRKKKAATSANGNGKADAKDGAKTAAKLTAKETAKLVVKPAKIEPAATSASKIFRVMFNEITPKAIRAAFEHPSQVNENLVDAQQARRVLDRLVGYKVSPLLWDKVRRGLSAGRVQTVALRLIVRARAGNPRVRSQRILDDACAPRGGRTASFRSQAHQVQRRRHRNSERSRSAACSRSCRARASGKWRASRKKKSAASRRHPSPLRSSSRPATIACASPPSAL